MGHDFNTFIWLKTRTGLGGSELECSFQEFAGGVRELQFPGASLIDKSETKYGNQDNKVEYDMSGVLLKNNTKRPNKQCNDLTLNYRVIAG